MNNIEALIKQAFKVDNSKPNHAFDERWLKREILEKLNPKEQELVNPAIDNLVKEGFITIEDRRGNCMVLTQKGYEELYPIDREKVINKIGVAILTRFAEQKSRVGHIIDERWINHNLIKKLNPREIELINDAINNIVNEGFATANNNPFSLALTKKGFEHIY